MDLVLLQVAHLHAHPGEPLPERLDRGEQQGGGAGVDGPDPDEPRGRQLVTGRLAQAVGSVEDLDDVLQQLAAGLADPGPGAPAVEQGDAELLLELGQRLAEGGLGDVQVLARATQRAVLDDGDDELELLEAHVGCSRCSGPMRVFGAGVWAGDRPMGRGDPGNLSAAVRFLITTKSIVFLDTDRYLGVIHSKEVTRVHHTDVLCAPGLAAPRGPSPDRQLPLSMTAAG